MRRLTAILATAALAAACSQAAPLTVDEPQVAADSPTTEPAAKRSPPPTVAPTPQLPPSPSPSPEPRPPTVTAECPDPFTVESNGAIVSVGIEWNTYESPAEHVGVRWGDGTVENTSDLSDSGLKQLLTHSYEAAGSYPVTLGVSDETDLYGEDTCTISFVSSPPAGNRPPPGRIDPNPFEDSGFDAASCTFEGIPLYGRVAVVESFPDFTVREVSNFEDLRVKVVDRFANSCGEWEFVDQFPDFTIKFVANFEDITIREVSNFPGT